MTANQTEVLSSSTTLSNKHTNDVVLNHTDISLIVVSSVLLITSIVAIICAFKLYLEKHSSVCLCGSTRTSVKDDDSVDSNKNYIISASSIASEKSLEMPETREITETGSHLKDEEQEKVYSFDVETKSLGMNTIAKREHKLDLQMQKMQQLFHAFEHESADSETIFNSSVNEVSQNLTATINSKEQSSILSSDSSSSKPYENDTKMQDSNPDELSDEMSVHVNTLATLPNLVNASNQVLDYENVVTETHF